MAYSGFHRRSVLLRVCLSALGGVLLAVCVWAIVLFQGLQATANSLQTTANAPNNFVLDVVFEPQRYLAIFALVGALIGGIAGSFFAKRLIKSRQAQQRDEKAGNNDAWPPPPTV